MGPDHPQIEIYNESKHGIAFYANRNRTALDKTGDWILGRDYAAAPTCATCHISGYVTPTGEVKPNSHDVGDRISWTLRRRQHRGRRLLRLQLPARPRGIAVCRRRQSLLERHV